MNKAILNSICISCVKATELTEKKLLFELTIGERAKLFFHNTQCRNCAHYNTQSLLLDEALSTILNNPDGSLLETPSTALENIKRDIIRKINAL